MTSTNWQGKNVLILGAARQGQALARFLASRKANVILNDRRSAAQLGTAVDALTSIGVEWVLDTHPLSLLDRVDLVCLSGGIPLTLPIVKAASERGLPLTNDSQVFIEEVKAPVIGITGSAGKTTTTTLVGRMAQKAVKAPRKAWVGGNIGLPLVEYLDEIKPEDFVILELSSFQLEQMTLSPHVAAVLNITPNHLDRHGTMEAYTSAKSRILNFQTSADYSILNREDPGSWDLASITRGTLFSFGFSSSAALENGSFLENGKVIFRRAGIDLPVFDSSEVELRGQHNLLLALAAVAICGVTGIPAEAMQAGIRGFTGVEHRMEPVRTWHGITFVNDSIATAPERTMAAIDSYDQPIILLLGGRDKDLPWDTIASKIHKRVSRVILFGEAAEKIYSAIGNPLVGDVLESVHSVGTFTSALEKAVEIACSGDVVLLSPGCTSYDAFRDFEERGNFFKKWVNELE
jgi:UDP-N-acetylmuramoylalanine--D-glutamate ligase